MTWVYIFKQDTIRSSKAIFYTCKWNCIHAMCQLILWTCWGHYFTWTELFYAAIAAADVHRQEVFEPVDLGVRVAAGSTQHCGSTSPLHYLQLGPHIYGGESMWDLVLCDKDINTGILTLTPWHDNWLMVFLVVNPNWAIIHPLHMAHQLFLLKENLPGEGGLSMGSSQWPTEEAACIGS